MNRHSYRLLIVLLTLICFGALTYVTHATEQVTGANVTMSQNQTSQDDLFLAGSTVQVLGEAKEDVVAAGRDVTIAGAVQGYLLLAGGNINITGPIGNDVYAAGGKLFLKAPVADNAVLAGGEIKLQPEATVHHDAILVGGNIEVASKIERNLKLAAGEARLSSEVGGNVQANVGKLTLAPNAIVRGHLKVFSPTPPAISPQAQVLGGVEYIQVERESLAVSWLRRWLFSFLALSLASLAVLALSPWWANRVTTLFASKPGEMLLTGLAGMILIPLAALLLMLTVIGLPLAFIVLALFVVALLLSGVFAAWFIGGWLLAQFKQPQAARWVRMIVGALAVSLFVSVPLFGVLFGLLVLLAGLGALLQGWRASWRPLPAEGIA